MGKRKRHSEIGNGVELEVAQPIKTKKSARLEQPTEASASEGISVRRRGPCGLLLTREGAFTDTGANDLDIQTFYSQEDEYSDLHSRYFLTNEKGRHQMEGLEWKKGKWSVQEIRLLKRNICAYMKEYCVSDIMPIVMAKDNKKQKVLYQYMAKGIQRPLFSVYRKAIRVLNIQNYVGMWTSEMDKELFRLHAIHGNQWEKIGKHMGISGRAVFDHFKYFSTLKNSGQWSPSEEQSLSSAVSEAQKERREATDDLPEDVRWEDVASKVGSRNASQCRQKWVTQLSWNQAGRQPAKWSAQDNLKLIHTLSYLDVEDEEEVDWKQLCEGWPAAHNASCLRLRWGALRRDVPHYQFNTLQENLDYLETNKVPALEQFCTHQE